MRHTLLLYTVVLALTVGCTGRNGGETKTVAQPSDTTYTQKAAMKIYGYQPMQQTIVVVRQLIEYANTIFGTYQQPAE